MHNWRKIGRTFCPQELENRPAWLHSFAQAPATLLFDDKLRIYFSCRPAPDEQGLYVSYSSFADFDRFDPTQLLRVSDNPILSLGSVGCFDEFGTYPVSVTREAGKVWAYYAGWTRCESVPFNVAIGCAVSDDDGVTFKKLGPGPILSYSLDEPFVLSGPKIRRFNGGWQLFYIAGRKWKLVNGQAEPVYKIRLAISDDGLNWRKSNHDLIESRIEEDEAQASPDVFYANGKYHMFFCYRYSENYRGKKGGYRIGYAWSEDLEHWTREDHKVGITVSSEGWDSEMISYPHVFELDGKIYMAYLGNQVGKGGFGLAVLDGNLE